MGKYYSSAPIFSSMKEAVTQLFTPSTIIQRKSPLSVRDGASTHILLLHDETKHSSSNSVLKQIVSKEYQGNQAMDRCQAEASGLMTIASTHSIATVHVYGIVSNNNNNSTLLLEYWEQHKASPHFWEHFAQTLAHMHMHPSVLDNNTQHTERPLFGFFHDNYLGDTVQKNTLHHSWLHFFTNERLLFQLQLAIHNTRITPHDAKKIEQLCSKLPLLIPDISMPSLLHGDLWSGNYLCVKKEQALLIDPAVYYGHYEADIAMTELFGSCDAQFYNTYNDILPLEKAYQERKHIYNLYHLLNHLNLFGTSYTPSVMNIVQYFL